METKIKIGLAVAFVISMLLPDFKGCNQDYSAVNVVTATFDMLTSDQPEPESTGVGNLDLALPIKNVASDFKVYMSIATLCLIASLVFFILHMFQKPGDVLNTKPWFMISGIILFIYLVDAYIIVEKGEQFFALKYGWFLHLLLSATLILYSRWMPALVNRFEPAEIPSSPIEVLPPIPSVFPGQPAPDEPPPPEERGFPQSGPPAI